MLRPAAPPVQGSVLIVDDEPATVTLLARILGPEHECHFAVTGAQALELARKAPPDLILLDYELPDLSGPEICGRIQDDPTLRSIPVLFVTGHRDARYELACFDAGAVDFITKPFSAPVVRARVRTQLLVKRYQDELRRLAHVDGLTGVANRRALDATLTAELARASRAGSPVSLVLFDIDHFKGFNDLHGHHAGDEALRAVAQTLTVACGRPSDLVARFGGEELAMVLPHTPEEGAVGVAERALELLHELAIPHGGDGAGPFLTFSAGVASSIEGTVGELVENADRALYQAKRNGRARVERAGARRREVA